MSPQPLNFSAIDFETSSSKRASVCQVGLTHVRNGRVESTESWYVIPPTGLDDFHPMNVAIHGITAEHVVQEGGLGWGESLSRIHSGCSGVPLVAHNSSFDKSVFEAACKESALDIPHLTWRDTLDLARREFPELPQHTLPVVASHVGVDLTQHHDAAADATAAAKIVLAVAAKRPSADFDELFGLSREVTPRGFDPKFLTDNGYTRKVSELPPPNPDADPEGPLFGQFVVLTGSLEGMTRGEAMDKMAERGAQVQNGVTKKTTMLVLAEWDTVPVNYDPSLGSSKERKAGQYNAKGQGIRFVGRKEFESWLRGPAIPTVRAVLNRGLEAVVQHEQDRQESPATLPSRWGPELEHDDAMPHGDPQTQQSLPDDTDAPRVVGTPERRSVPSALLPQTAAEPPQGPTRHPTAAHHVEGGPKEPAPQGTHSVGEAEAPRTRVHHGAAEGAGDTSASATGRVHQHGRSRGGFRASSLLVLGVVLAVLNGLGLLVFLIPLVYGMSQHDGQLLFGSLLFVAVFAVFLGVGVLLTVLGVRARRGKTESQPGADWSGGAHRGNLT